MVGEVRKKRYPRKILRFRDQDQKVCNSWRWRGEGPAKDSEMEPLELQAEYQGCGVTRVKKKSLFKE